MSQRLPHPALLLSDRMPVASGLADVLPLTSPALRRATAAVIDAGMVPMPVVYTPKVDKAGQARASITLNIDPTRGPLIVWQLRPAWDTNVVTGNPDALITLRSTGRLLTEGTVHGIDALGDDGLLTTPFYVGRGQQVRMTLEGTNAFTETDGVILCAISLADAPQEKAAALIAALIQEGEWYANGIVRTTTDTGSITGGSVIIEKMKLAFSDFSVEGTVTPSAVRLQVGGFYITPENGVDAGWEQNGLRFPCGPTSTIRQELQYPTPGTPVSSRFTLVGRRSEVTAEAC